jgi:serine/threonine protein kinase
VETSRLRAGLIDRQNVPTAPRGKRKSRDVKICPQCNTKFPNEHTTCSHDGEWLIEADLEPGTIVRNKYRIEKTLGRGGMGIVYLAEHRLLHQLRALKFISRQFSSDAHSLKRFRQEAQAATQLSHINIVKVMDLDQADDGSPFIAMEFVPGQDLEQALHAGSMPVARTLNIARGVAEGLGCAHAQGILHRDVKPSNIRLGRGSGGMEIPKLLDFGIAAIRESSSNLTRTHGHMLTPPYAAPEQWEEWPAEKMDGRVDLYALGGVLFEMLTGELCFREGQGWMHQHLYGQRRSPSSVRPELKQWPQLDALVVRMLAVDRDQRPRDVADFLRELDQAEGKSPPIRVETQVETRIEVPWRESVDKKTSPPVQRKSPVSRSAVFGGVLLIALLVAAFVAWRVWPTRLTVGGERTSPQPTLREVDKAQPETSAEHPSRPADKTQVETPTNQPTPRQADKTPPERPADQPTSRPADKTQPETADPPVSSGDPLAKLSKLGFQMNYDGYFMAAEMGRADVLGLYLDAGIPPYTKKTLDNNTGTALTWALRKTPKFCDLLPVYKQHGVDITSFKANKGDNGTTEEDMDLMDEAINAANVAAIKCLKPYFPDTASYTTFLTRSIALMRQLTQADGSQQLSSVLAKCSEDVRVIFARPEQYQHLSGQSKADLNEIFNNACRSQTVGDFRRTVCHSDLSVCTQDHQNSLGALQE